MNFDFKKTIREFLVFTGLLLSYSLIVGIGTILLMLYRPEWAKPFFFYAAIGIGVFLAIFLRVREWKRIWDKMWDTFFPDAKK